MSVEIECVRIGKTMGEIFVLTPVIFLSVVERVTSSSVDEKASFQRNRLLNESRKRKRTQSCS